MSGPRRRPRRSSTPSRPNATTPTAAPPSATTSIVEVKNTAMSRIATRSSSTASASRKTRTPAGRARPNVASTPRAKAMSVAVGTGHPFASPSSMPPSAPTTPRNTSAGTAMPPTAAMPGTTAFETEFSDPAVSLCFSSTATMKKNTASRPSLIQWPTDSSMPSAGMSRCAAFASRRKGPAAVLARTSPTTAARSSSTAALRSERMTLMVSDRMRGGTGMTTRVPTRLPGSPPPILSGAGGPPGA